MNKNLIILAVLIVLVALGAWFWNSSYYQPSTATSTAAEDTTTAISDDLSNINVESDVQDFNAVDVDIQTL